MKKLLIIALFTLTSFNLDKEVYICGEKGAKKYHYIESCRGLSACKHEIKKVKLNEAKSFGLDICGWED
jgi:hypothetical protein